VIRPGRLCGGATAWRVGLLLWAVYLLSYGGGPHSPDEIGQLATTASLVRRGGFDANEIFWTIPAAGGRSDAQVEIGPSGDVWSVRGPTVPLVMAPWYALARWSGLDMTFATLLSSSLVSAATGGLLVLIGVRLGLSTGAAAAGGLLYGLATMAWPYSRLGFGEPTIALLVVLAALLSPLGVGGAAAAGLAVAAAAGAKWSAAALAAPIGLYLFTPGWAGGGAARAGALRRGLVFAGAALVGLLLLAWHNWARYGSPLLTGYELAGREQFSTPPLFGLAGLTLSPYRGVLWFVPLVGAALLLAPSAAVRARRFVWLALAALPAATTIPAVSDLYRAANGPGHVHSAIAELHGVGRVALITTGVALVVGAVAALTDRRLPTPGRRSALANRVVGAGLATVMLAGSVAFVASVGDPIDWLGQRVSQFRSGREPSAARTIRFSLNAGSSRVGLWRVALIDARDHPLLGDGGGGFRYTYLRKRRATDGILQAHDAHSVELENLAEFGAPGLLLFLCAVGGAGVGVVRARRAGPLSAGAYWLVHSSVDWFWPYPGITGPVFALLGSACAPALRTSRAPARGRGRLLLAAAAVLLAVSTVPPFLSQRYVNEAYAVWQSDPAGAYRDLDRARSLNPLSVDPLLAEGAIARANGDRNRAVAAFREATVKRPEEWASYYYLALLRRKQAPRLARRDLLAARERDPYDPQLTALARKLRASRSQS
jgi:hypothetical protein